MILILYIFLSCFNFVLGNIPLTEILSWNAPQFKLSETELSHAKKVRDHIHIQMTLHETAFFLNFIQNGTDYFEFGCGGSTFVASAYGPPQLNISSVDSSIEWINKIKENKLCSLKLARNLLHMDLVDIGSVGMWGFPTNEEKKEAWHLYSQSISLTNTKYDRILVDGRFRVACVLYSFLSNPQARVLLHDFFHYDHHEEYKILLQVLDIVKYVDSLVELKVKNNVRYSEILNMYNAYTKTVKR